MDKPGEGRGRRLREWRLWVGTEKEGRSGACYVERAREREIGREISIWT